MHRLDAAELVSRALEKSPGGSIVHAVAEEGIPARQIAEVIGRHLTVPVVSIAAEQAADHFGWIGALFARDIRASSALTRELLGWTPTRPGLLEGLESGHYFQPVPAGATG